PLADSSTSYDSTAPPYEDPGYSEPPKFIPLKKVISTPYRHGKILVNAVYIAREGDTIESISQKVFGTTARKGELCEVNAYNCSRGVKVGDKYYYNSPQRPDDDSTVKVF